MPIADSNSFVFLLHVRRTRPSNSLQSTVRSVWNRKLLQDAPPLVVRFIQKIIFVFEAQSTELKMVNTGELTPQFLQSSFVLLTNSQNSFLREAYITSLLISLPNVSLSFLPTVMTENAFKAKDVGLRVQKKILSRMASKNVAKVFIDETTSSLLDNVYKLTKLHLGSKKDAEKLVKNIIKIVIKLAILQKNEVFSEDETRKTNAFYQKFLKLQMSIISFFEVDFSFDLIYLQKLITDVHQLLKEIVKNHLTDKSLNKIDEIFESFNNPQFLESAFKTDSPHREIMGKIVVDLNKVMEQNE